jgi:hypothetical protein
LNLGQYPLFGYVLLTPEEAAVQPPIMPVQLPLWSEILMAPEPDSPIPIEDGRGCRSRIGIPTHFFAPTPSGVCP